MANDKSSKPSAKTDGGAKQAQQTMDTWTEQGFRGVKVDPTPNENYTVAGVTSAAPTPETDVDLEAEAAGAAGPLAAAAADAEATSRGTNSNG
jgi:hypothetical protein